MSKISRRSFLALAIAAPLAGMSKPLDKAMTVQGLVSARRLGITLPHEHVLVDFIGADVVDDSRWDKLEVVNHVIPFVAAAKAHGVKTLVECTPAFLGRDPRLLKMLSDKTGLQIITNTGYYGAVNDKYLPPWAFTETAAQLAQRWVDDFDYGIDGSTVRPGIIKIGVDADKPLKPTHAKLVQAAALTHLRTGLTIYSHTGPAHAAVEQIGILAREGVAPEAFVWVHAQNEKNVQEFEKIGRMGAWVSLDGITSDYDRYTKIIAMMKNRGLLRRVLLSHDAGYYKPGEPGGGDFTGYTSLFTELIPRLLAAGFSKREINRLLEVNTREALTIGVRKIRR